MTTQTPGWLNKVEYPFESKFINQQGHQQHYIDTGKGEPIVFVHGTPSWSFDFRHVIKTLSQINRCIALDHIGFGLSAKKPDYDYSLKNHTNNLTQLINHLQLKNITLVLHDFGGPIGLEYALNHAENVQKIVIMNSWIGSSENEPEFQKMKKILKSPVLPFLYLRLNFSPRFLMPQSFGKRKMDGKTRKQFTQPFPSKNERHGMLNFAQSLLKDQPFFEDQRNRIQGISNKPTLLIWGLKDKFAGPLYLERFKKCIPQARVIELPETGHFPQEEQPETVAASIRQWLHE